jgi:manganese/zinc/iron transport system permease protein
MFAGGVLLLEQSDTSSVHLDVEHALMGNLESLIWLTARAGGRCWTRSALAGLPPELPRMRWWRRWWALTAGVLAALEDLDLRRGLCPRTMGLPVGLIGLGLVIVAAMAAVAAFDAVGSIIVIAMFICPPAAARLMTDRLGAQVAWSVGFAASACWATCWRATGRSGWGPRTRSARRA